MLLGLRAWFPGGIAPLGDRMSHTAYKFSSLAHLDVLQVPGASVPHRTDDPVGNLYALIIRAA